MKSFMIALMVFTTSVVNALENRTVVYLESLKNTVQEVNRRVWVDQILNKDASMDGWDEKSRVEYYRGVSAGYDVAIHVIQHAIEVASQDRECK